MTGSAYNQAGRSSGLTAPNGPAQSALIRQGTPLTRRTSQIQWAFQGFAALLKGFFLGCILNALVCWRCTHIALGRWKTYYPSLIFLHQDGACGGGAVAARRGAGERARHGNAPGRPHRGRRAWPGPGRRAGAALPRHPGWVFARRRPHLPAAQTLTSWPPLILRSSR